MLKQLGEDEPYKKRCEGVIGPGYTNKCLYPVHGKGYKIGRLPMIAGPNTPWSGGEAREHAM